MKRTYELRRDALGATLIIENALEEYQQKYAAPAKTLDLLLEHQILPELPVDPYGGVFYLDEQGRVRSSSQFTDQKP